MATAIEYGLIAVGLVVAITAVGTTVSVPTTSAPLCAPLGRQNDTCVGTLVQMKNGDILRVAPRGDTNGNRSPQDVAVLQSEGKIVGLIDPAREDFPRVAAQFVVQANEQ